MNTELDRASDRAITDNRSTETRENYPVPEPLNRRGRRNLAAEYRRLDRRAQRSLRRQELDRR